MAEDAPYSDPEDSRLRERHIRVFVSSTFRDMQEDRDYLVKFIFPQLRQMCEARGVTWGEVDLRWGITEEEAAEGKVLPLCLEEIRRCRPYFIGLLGERYGWVPKPEAIPGDLLEREEWLNDHLQCSVTELEIIHGVLREEQMHGRAFFYVRDPSYLDRLPEGRDAADFQCESAEAETKLDRLKSRIRAARDKQVCQLRENYHDPEELGNWILEDFKGLIEELYPEDEQPSRLDCEAAGHEAFARSRAGVYIGRQGYFERLDAHVAADGPPLVVLGESGSGKSALLANWFLDYTAKHPDDFALIHFIGSTADSADATQLMQRIMLELKRRFDLAEDVPAMPDEIRDQFPQWLDKVAGAGRIVLVLDALNQLTDQDNAPDLGWLPVVLPPSCRVILSTLPGRSLDAVRRRKWPEMRVEPLTQSEREELIEKFLAQFSRRLSRERVERIAAADQAANPLFLRAMLDELRQFGEHERLGEMIEHYLAAADPKDLYGRILQRWENDYGEELVQRSLSLLWAARRGLAESELLDLLGTGDQPLPRATWTSFYLAAESCLTRRSGLLGFFHDYVRNAVEARCIPTDDARKACHHKLADYFHRRPEMSGRELDELPWQWQQAEEWTDLKNLLTQMKVFERLRSEERWEQDLRSYWLALGPHHDPCDAYREALDRWETESDRSETFAVAISHLADFHLERAELSAAEPLMRRSLAINEQTYGGDHVEVATGLNNLSQLLQAKNCLVEAEPLYRRALAITEKVLGSVNSLVAAIKNNLAQLCDSQGRFAEAQSLYESSLTISRRVLGPMHPKVGIITSSLGRVYRSQGQHIEAERLFRSALALVEQSLGREHPSVATVLSNLGDLMLDTCRLDEAEEVSRRALDIDTQAFGPNHPNVARDIGNLAQVLRVAQRLDEAESLMWQALRIDEATLGPDHPNVALRLSNLVGLYLTIELPQKAEPLANRALDIDRKALGPNHPNVAIRLNNLGGVYQNTNRMAQAKQAYRESISINEAAFGPKHLSLAMPLNNLATISLIDGRLEEAEALMRRVVEVFLQFHANTGRQHPHEHSALNSYGAILMKKGCSEQQMLDQIGAIAADFDLVTRS